MNAVAFGVIAALLLGSIVSVIVADSVRYIGPAYALVVLTTAALLAATGSVLLAAALVISTGSSAVATYVVLQSENEREILEEKWSRSSHWRFEIPVVVVLGVALVITMLYAGDWHRGGSQASLATLLHYRYPIVVIALVALALITLFSFLGVGRVTRDEQSHAQLRADKEMRAERAARRRADRAAALQQKRDSRRDRS